MLVILVIMVKPYVLSAFGSKVEPLAMGLPDEKKKTADAG